MRRFDLSSVNWWDGMLVSQADFCAQEKYHEEALHWLQRYGWPLYGVLPSFPGDTPSLELAADIVEDSQLRVNLLQCHALTRDGAAIHIDAGSPSQQANPVVGLLPLNPQLARTVPVYIRPAAEKQSWGDPDSTGNPARRSRQFEVILDETQVTDDGTALKIAELQVDNYQVVQKDDYFPPCLTVQAVPSLQQFTQDLTSLARETLGDSVRFLAASPPQQESHPWHACARGVMSMVVTGWSLQLDAMSGAEAVSPPAFVAGIHALLRVFGNALGSYLPAKETLDEEFLQAGGLPSLAGGIDFHTAVARFIDTPYAHDAVGPQLREGQRLVESARACLGFLGEKLATDVGPATPAPRPKVTYRQQDYYLLDVDKIESSFSDDSQVLYFQGLGTADMRSVLFVLRNTAGDEADTRDIRLKGGVNDDRPLYCPDLQPDFKERPGHIFLLLEVEPGKRDKVDYITLRSSSVVNLEELLKKKDTDIRVYYL